MATQKKYHNLVLLDEASEASQLDIKKLVSILFLFLVGIVIGAVFISFLYEEQYKMLQPQPTSLSASTDSLIQTQEVASGKLQSITELTPVSDKSSGCSIESLGRNTVEKGCSVDDYKEIPADTALIDSSIATTGLDGLISSEDTVKKTDDSAVEGITNILDLK
jgi:hypothetical protein